MISPDKPRLAAFRSARRSGDMCGSISYLIAVFTLLRFRAGMHLAQAGSDNSTPAPPRKRRTHLLHLRSPLTPAPSLKCRSTARRSPPSVFQRQNPSTTKPAKKAQNARSAKRPRPPRRRLGPARPQHLLRGRAERRARGRGAVIDALFPWKLLPARLRPDRAAAALRGRRTRIKHVRPLHMWLVLLPNHAVVRPRRLRPGLHATATLLLPPEEGRARHVYCRERYVLEGDLGPHEPGPVPHGHLARDLVDW